MKTLLILLLISWVFIAYEIYVAPFNNNEDEN